MWSGDSLTVLLFFLGSALAAMIGAVTAPQGWRTQFLWGLFAAFALTVLWLLLAPSASPIVQAVRPVLSAIVDSNALAMVLIVGIVALMIGPRSKAREVPAEQVATPALPKFAVAPTTKWTPDVSFRGGIHYVGAQSLWKYAYAPNDVSNTTEELISALAANKITAWDREHPGDGELFEIRQGFWGRADVTVNTDYAYSHRDQIGVYDVHLCQKQMEQVWPPKPEA